MSASAPVLDLLGEPRRLRVGARGLRQALAFAFASGGEQEAFARALSEADFSGSLWSGDCFRDDLFLPELLDRCLWRGRIAPRSSVGPGVRGYLLAALASPPSGPGAAAVVALRQGITAELLSSPALFERALGMIGRLQQLFELLEAGGVGLRLDATRRSLDILAALKAVVDDCGHFAGADSALTRIAEWAEVVRAGQGYARLENLLDYEARQAQVTVNVRLGRHGELRGLDVVRVEENRNNPLHVSPWRRFLGRFSLWFRGFRLREAEVYGRLIGDVFDGIVGLVPTLLQLLAELEFYRLGVSLSRFAGERGLAVCLPQLGSSEREIHDLFNPFLLLEERPPRPCDLATGGPGTVVVLTGPNSGGKTRLIQALVLCQVLAQGGLPVPASAARLPWQDGLFASLGVGSSAEQREGRLGTELLRIRRLFEKLYCPTPMALGSILTSSANGSMSRRPIETAPRTVTS
jgi:DNA mismatch repair protein MutS2